MPKKKPWEIQGVSKSTHYRNQRRSEIKGSESVEIEKPSSGLLPDVDMTESGPQSSTDAPPMVLTDAEVALIGDFMVGLRSGRQIDDRFPVAVAPRLFRAVISALIKAGY